jgi:transcriptional regulator with XRE-family HTH domain
VARHLYVVYLKSYSFPSIFALKSANGLKVAGFTSAARINMNISQAELSNRSGVSPKTIGHLENGRKSTGLLNMIAIMRALNLIHEIEHFMPRPPPSAKSFIAEGGNIKVRKRASSSSNYRQAMA